MEDPKKLEEGFSNQKNNISEENIDTNRIDNNQDLVSHENDQKILSQPLQKKEEEEPIIKKGKRVATLDAFRGLTIVVRDLTYIY